ncbi:MAG: Ig-like domain-containing protein [Clostridia bacterium]|nr:Ig-like domain-containing protein [Clostridia bacterium]
MNKRIFLIALMLLMLIVPAMDTSAFTARADAAPERVVLNRTSVVIDLAESSSFRLEADVLPSDARQTVRWSTSDSDVVKVSSSGKLSARGRGTAVVTATAYKTNVKTQCYVTVIDSDIPDRVEIGAATLTLNRYQTHQLTATVTPSTAVQRVKWKTSSSSIVKVSSSGLLTARKAGTATITCYSAEDSKVLDKVVVTVKKQDTPKSIHLTPATDVLVVGETLQLNAQQLPADACGYFEWRTSSSSRAKVSDTGLVTARKTGWVTITCRSMQSSSIRATRKILIVSASSPHRIDPGVTELTLNPGKTYQLSPEVLPAGKDSRVRYSTSSSSIVKVSDTGLITARKAGTATITIKSRANSNVVATVKIKVENLPAPTSLKISASSAVVAKGGELKLTAVPYPAGASAQVSWKSSNTSVARVSDSGVVTGRKGGVAVITATSSRNSKVKVSYSVTVSDPKSPTSIKLNAALITMEIGEERKMQATVNPSTGVETGIKWSTSSSSVARVSSKGVITARKAGTAIITASSTYNSSIGANVMVTVVSRSAPTSITANVGKTALSVGETAQITMTTQPTGASKLFKYSSSASSVVSVSEDGLLTAKKPGTATITVQSSKKSSVKTTLKITVYDATTPRTLSLNTTLLYLGEDDTTVLVPSITPANAVKTVSWKSSNKDVVSVSESGKLTAKKPGTATITCTTTKGGLTATCTVTVLDTTLATEIPARTTKTSGIASNLAKIEAIRKSAVNQVLSLAVSGKISGTESAARQLVIDRAFEMQAFPWMTKKVQEYWSKAYAYKRYLPDTVYYGLPYIQTGPSNGYVNRRYNVEKALSENRYTATGKGYYLLNQDKLLDGMYCGNDCSAFVSMSQFGTKHSASYLNTTGIAKSTYYRTISDYASLRPGDILVKSGDHTIIFLYYVDAFKNKMMIIEQGGNGSTVICSIYDTAWFSSRGYVPRRQVSFSMN